MTAILKCLLPVGLALSLPFSTRAELQASSGSLNSVAGFYSGLMYEPTNIVHQHSGSFFLKLSRSGWISGHAFVAGALFWFNGPFHQEGIKTNGAATIGLSRYTLRLQFDLTNGTDQVTGTLDNSHWDNNGNTVPATWTAEVLGDRDTFHSRTNPAPQAGSYTLVLPGGTGTNEPAGAGFASIRIDTSGNVWITGSLADGTPFLSSTILAKDGRFRLYKALYGGRGSLIGWVTFADLPESDLSGSLTWTRPRISWAWAYRNGFTNQLEAVGSVFIANRNLNQVLNFTNGVATFTDGGLTGSVVDTFRVDPSRITNTSSNLFSLTVSSSSGKFRGSFAEPGSTLSLGFCGAYLQKQTRGYGYFFGNNNLSGLVTLEPEP